MKVKMQMAMAGARLTTVMVAGILCLLAPAVQAGVADCGMLTNFASVTYSNTAGDPYEASYAVTAPFKVASPNLVISKYATPTIQGAGGTVFFCINFQNLSYCASAINVLVRDKVPDNMNFIVIGPNYYAWTNGPNNGTDADEYAAVSTGPWTPGEPAVAGNYWLRWSFPMLAPRESGVICFRATVL